MVGLTDEELVQIQTYIDRGRRELEGYGFAIEVGTDLNTWAAMLPYAPGSRYTASTHDPNHCNIHPGNAFWLSVREKSPRWWERPLRRRGMVVACLCHRVIDTEDIVEEVRTHRLFFNKKPVLNFRAVNVVASDNMPTIGGRVGFGGGFWVHPKYRGLRISNIVSRLTRVLSLRHFGIDWAIVFVKDTDRRKMMVEHTVGMPHCVSLIKGYYPPYGIDYDISMGYIHRDEIVRQVFEENRAAQDKSLDTAPLQAVARSAHGGEPAAMAN